VKEEEEEEEEEEEGEGGRGRGGEEEEEKEKEEIGHDGVDWIGLAVVRNRWWAVVNRMTTLRVI
jgi:hypothetical protein